jgi:hypothetical protein
MVTIGNVTNSYWEDMEYVKVDVQKEQIGGILDTGAFILNSASKFGGAVTGSVTSLAKNMN